MNTAQKWKYGLLGALLPAVAVILLLAVLVTAFNYVSKMGPAEIERKTQHYAQLAAYTPKNATVFFGDSITELCRIDDLYGEYSLQTGVPIVNRGISAETTASMLARLEESILAIQPRNLVMLMGVNDLNQGVSQEDITENIRQMIQLVKTNSPATNLVLQAIYPTDSARESLFERFQLRGRESATILALNEKLAEMARQENVHFIDVTNILADENGNLRKDYTYDGLHPNVSGYLAVRDSILEALK